MELRRTVFLCLILTFGLRAQCYGQAARTQTCVTFAADGTFATGTLKTDGLETTLNEPGAAVVTTHTPLHDFRGCEEIFSDDGKWLATVVPSDELTVVVHDRKTGTVHRIFSSAWQKFGKSPLEWAYNFSYLGGFLPDDSVALWRYVTRDGVNPSFGSNVDLHLQRWSVEGELLSDQNLGDIGFGVLGRQPIPVNGLGFLWLPGKCSPICYRGVKVFESQVEQVGNLALPNHTAAEPVPLSRGDELLIVVGDRTAQKATLLDPAGHLLKQVSLPYFPNLLGPLVPDWFYARRPAISKDGQIAAIVRTRVAWVLVDTDRDWGSEIVLLKTDPLAVTTVLKTGKGGIGAVAVDHRNGIVRMVGFWKGRWHDLKYDEGHPGKWTAVRSDGSNNSAALLYDSLPCSNL